MPVQAQGNIEDWLLALEAHMTSMRPFIYDFRPRCSARCAGSATSAPGSVARSVTLSPLLFSGGSCEVLNGTSMSEFGKKCIAQVSLLGIQLIWTTDFQDALTRMSKDGQEKFEVGPTTKQKPCRNGDVLRR